MSIAVTTETNAVPWRPENRKQAVGHRARRLLFYPVTMKLVQWILSGESSVLALRCPGIRESAVSDARGKGR